MHRRVGQSVVTSNGRHVRTLSGMGSKGTADHRRRRAEAERHLRQKAEQAQSQPGRSRATDSRKRVPGRRDAATTCAWCGGPITARSRGPMPKWCSATCRHRAWEQTASRSVRPVRRADCRAARRDSRPRHTGTPRPVRPTRRACPPDRRRAHSRPRPARPVRRARRRPRGVPLSPLCAQRIHRVPAPGARPAGPVRLSADGAAGTAAAWRLSGALSVSHRLGAGVAEPIAAERRHRRVVVLRHAST